MTVREIIDELSRTTYSAGGFGASGNKCRSLVRQLDEACKVEGCTVDQALNLDDSYEARYTWENVVWDMGGRDITHPGFAPDPQE